MITQALSLLGGLFTLAPLAGLRTYLAAVGLLGLALHQFSVGAFDAAAQSLLAALAAFGVRSAIGRNAPQPEPPITIARLSPAAGLMAAIAGVAAIVLAVDGAGGVPQPGTAEVLAGETLIRLPPGELAPIDTGGISLLEQTPDWGHAAINVPDAWKQTRGRGARVAVLDTGVDAGHDDLRANVKRTLNTTNSSTSADRQGHGTHCAGIIAAADNDVGLVGVAPEAEIVSVKVLGDDGSGLGSWIAAGIDLAIAERVDVISMSLGSPGEDPRIKAAVTRAYAAGVIVVAAAGNDGPREGTIGYPGAQAECICVGASNRGGAVAQFSSRGARLDVVAHQRGEDQIALHHVLHRGDHREQAAEEFGEGALLLGNAGRGRLEGTLRCAAVLVPGPDDAGDHRQHGQDQVEHHGEAHGGQARVNVDDLRMQRPVTASAETISCDDRRRARRGRLPAESPPSRPASCASCPSSAFPAASSCG